MHAHLLIYHGAHVEVRGKLGGAGAVLPPCGSQDLIQAIRLGGNFLYLLSGPMS